MDVTEIVKSIVPNLIGYCYIIAGSIIFTNYKAMSNKYKLVKDNKLSESKVIFESEALQATRSIRSSNLSKEIKDIIEKIPIKLSSEVSSDSLNIIKRNLSSLKDTTGVINSISLTLHSGGGEYHPLLHSISLNKYASLALSKNIGLEQEQIIKIILSHELMHAASSYKEDNKIAAGFHQRYIINMGNNKDYSIGVGINEGYTDLISKRYLVEDYGTDRIGYYYEEKIAELTELIVGKDKMINLYFQANLKGLVEELSKYSSLEEAKEFIVALDTILNTKRNKFIIEKDDVIITLMNKVNTYLYKAFNNKTNIDPNYKNIDNYLKDSDKFLEVFTAIEEDSKTEKRNIRS